MQSLYIKIFLILKIKSLNYLIINLLIFKISKTKNFNKKFICNNIFVTNI